MKVSLFSLAGLCLFTLFLHGSDTIVYQWRLRCETEDAWVFVWSEDRPTLCPNNSNDTIVPGSISQVGELGSNLVKIQEEQVQTGGHFRTETVRIDVATGPDVSSSVTRSWPIPVSVLEINFNTVAENKGDNLSLDIPFDLFVGTIAQDVAINDTTISVTSTVIENVSVGYFITLSDGISTNDLGLILSIDEENETITVEQAATDIFLLADSTVLLTVSVINNYEFGDPATHSIGHSTIGSQHVPVNTTARLTYMNQGASSKTFIVSYDYLY